MYTDLGRPGIHLWLRATEQSSFYNDGAIRPTGLLLYNIYKRASSRNTKSKPVKYPKYLYEYNAGSNNYNKTN